MSVRSYDTDTDWHLSQNPLLKFFASVTAYGPLIPGDTCSQVLLPTTIES